MARMFRDATPGAGSGAGAAGNVLWQGVAILLAFDAVYLVVSWLVFELVLEP
jgi:hypothetical protein